MQISGGTVKLTGDVTLTGGVYTTDVNDYVADGYGDVSVNGMFKENYRAVVEVKDE